MGAHEHTEEDKLTSFLYTNSFHNIYVTGNPEKRFLKLSDGPLFNWVKTSPEEFIKILNSANENTLLTRRANIFYILAEAFVDDTISTTIKARVKETLFKFIKCDEEFFDFVKYCTLRRGGKQKISSSLKKLIVKFYKDKSPLDLAKCVTAQDSYHGWTHKNLFKLCHFKSPTVGAEPVLKYVLFGVEQLPEVEDSSSKTVITLLKQTNQLRTTEDAKKAAKLVAKLHANVDQVNSKLNKNEDVWLAAVAEMSTREVLQSLYRLYQLNFLKSGNQFQGKIIEALTKPEKVKEGNLHPIEVFIYLKFFEKGGKVMDPKLIDYLQKKKIKDETLKRLTTPSEPKCKAIVQHVGRCLTLSYGNVQPTGKKFLVTIDVTEKLEENCLHNRRISCLEAVHAIIKFLSRVEKNVTVAVFKDSHINVVDLSKSHSAVEKLQEHKSAYIVPVAPIEWARKKKKPVDVFINFMSCNWYGEVPKEVREKMDKIPEALNKYASKMSLSDVRLVKMYLGGMPTAMFECRKNVLTICGLSVNVPRVLEAFCRGHFS